MKQFFKKVAVTGPESTGKSWLTRKLADYYIAGFVDEYARDFISGLKREYNQEDILTIAQNQIIKESREEKKARGFLFCDTELIVTKIWSLHKYGTVDPWIIRQIEANRYDLYLLCNVDLPWEFDEQREHPHLRNYFFEWYKKELESYGFPFAVVSGIGEQRVLNAVAAVNDFFSLKDKE